LSTKAGYVLLFNDSEKIELGLKLKNRESKRINLDYIPKPDWNKQTSAVKLNNDNNLLYTQIFKNKSQSIGYFAWNGMSSREMVEEVAKNSPSYLDMNLNAMYKTLKIPRPDDDKKAIEGIPALYPVFSDLLKTMKEQKSDYLIIDLRHNGGGMAPLCNPLLYMLFGDKYLNYDCKAEYNRRLSRLQLKKWGLDSIEQYNADNKTNYLIGDFMFGYFFDSQSKKSIEEKRKDLSLISYYGGIGIEYTQNLNGKPIYEPVIIVLTSPKTFSAAYHFTYFLTQIGKTYIVGVPSRQAGNTFMETTSFELPNTKISGSISSSLQIFYPDDPQKGKVLMPNFIMNWNDFVKYDFDSNSEILFVLDLINNKKIKW
jgi:C-terminal processing protease CtpA/Prc